MRRDVLSRENCRHTGAQRTRRECPEQGYRGPKLQRIRALADVQVEVVRRFFLAVPTKDMGSTCPFCRDISSGNARYRRLTCASKAAGLCWA
jgi:hypothetical protein